MARNALRTIIGYVGPPFLGCEYSLRRGTNQRNMEIILGYDLDIGDLAYMPAELTTAIAQLWADAEFKRTVNEYAWDSVQMDSAA